MKRSLMIKSLLVVAVLIWSVISLVPTLRLMRLPAAERASMDATAEGRAQLDGITERAIKLGLDLQGGMYLVLEVDKSQLDPDAAEDAMDRVVEILRNRIDQFGVSEPVIQKQGDSRIIVQLPGLQDPERAKDLIGRTARLEFRLVREAGDVTGLLPKLDRVLAAELRGAPPDTTATASAPTDVAQTAAAATDTAAPANPFTAPDQLAAGDAGADEEDAAALDDDRPLSALLGPFMSNFGATPVSERNRARVTQLLASESVKRAMPRDLEFLWGSETFRAQGGGRAFLLYLVEKEVRLDGGEISNALISPDPDAPTAMQVNLEFSRRGGLRFANITGANVGRKLGIVLDSVVNSAPVIRDKISGGRAVIQGNFTAETARDLKVVLRAGALPADVRIEEERTIGPSLGRDSIQTGTSAALWSCGLVIVFMMVYYRLAGVVSAAGLFLTMVSLMAVLAQLHLTLTLPGIAGMVLTLGMAVDANVLIYERIREELRKEKSVRAAIDAGFHNAARTIADANLTTLAAGIVLYIFGTGPIKGFAVTLNIGIITSMFAALVFTRVVYDLWLTNRNPTRMSI
jgi:protein-export membrane protein SecD